MTGTDTGLRLMPDCADALRASVPIKSHRGDAEGAEESTRQIIHRKGAEGAKKKGTFWFLLSSIHLYFLIALKSGMSPFFTRD
jgi:hypothetical protein